MMLTKWPRGNALLIVFVAHFAFAVVLGPAFFAPVLLEEPRFAEVPRAFGEYWWEILSLSWVESLDEVGFWLVVGLIAAWAGLATAFVAPVVGPVRTTDAGRSLWSSVIAASLLGATMAAMMFAALVEGAVAMLAADMSEFSSAYDSTAALIWSGAAASWLLSGFAWMFCLRRVGRTRDPGALDRIIRALFAGTAVELVLGVPIFLMARKKYDCYCAMATFLNLIMGTAALFWLCGPWAILLYTRDARRNWARGACRSCGYPRRSGGEVCPECGSPLQN